MRLFNTLVMALAAVSLSVSASYADLFVPGNFQDPLAGEQATDWQLGAAPTMNDLGNGLFDLSLSGLDPSTRYQFKIVDSPNPTPAWGDGEVPDNGAGSPNAWFLSDGIGNATITLDRNSPMDGLKIEQDRLTVDSDSTITDFFATGDWEVQAGGAADNSGNDPLFKMTNTSGSLWEADATISTAGNYTFWVAADVGAAGTGDNLDNNFSANGRLVDHEAGAFQSFDFITVAADQEVTFQFDLSKGAIGFDQGTFILGDTNNNGVVDFEDDFGPIRDNWLEATFIRAEGNINNTGDSTGVVDIADFREWKDACTLENCATPAQIASAFTSLGVPEPSSLALAIFAVFGLTAGIRKR